MSEKTRSIYQELFVNFLILKVIIFAVSQIAVLTISPNDNSGELLVFASKNLNIFDRFLKNLVVPMISWDAVHMLAIATKGYTEELQFAFFPLLPMISGYVAVFFYEFCGLKQVVSIEPLTAFVALIFTNTCHFLASIMLYKLTHLLFKSSKFARIVALLFIYNAASVQLSSMYTEAPFAFLTFTGLYAFYTHKHFLASLFWALAASTRSNGIVLIGFFAFNLLQTFFHESSIVRLIKKALMAVIYSLISISGFLSFQFYGYSRYCMIENPTRPWCTWKIPNIYSFVQKEYWNVGFLNYFRFKQIPNFLVATPMIIICCSAVYFYYDFDHLRFLTLGLYRDPKISKKKSKIHAPFFNDCILPHVYLLIFMLFTNIFIAHVQIITRVFTFMPIVYWFMAHIIINFSSRIRDYLLVFIGAYGIIVTALFSLNYPPA